MPKVLFVNSTDPAAEFQNRYPPLWPCYLEAYAEKRLGPEALDFRFAKGSFEKELDDYRPDVVGIGTPSQHWERAKTQAHLAKRSGAHVIVGGPHITFLRDALSEHMDVGVVGEGEQTFLRLMQLLLDRGEFEPEHLSNIRGILYHDDGQVVRTAPRPLIRQLDEIPHPKRSLVGYGEMSYIMSSRGCPFKCVFCASSKFWGKYRLASEEYVVEEVVELYEHGTKIIRILDDLFTVNKRRLRRIVNLLAERNILGKVGFSVCCRANLVSEQLVALLKQLNVVSVLLGLESGCERTLQYLKGNVTVEDNRKAVQLFKDAGIQTNGLFIIGSPDETEEEIMETYEFIRQSPLDFVDVFLMTPLPGTEIWEDALSRGLVSSSMDWGLLDMRVRYQDGSVPIVSKHLSQDELRRLHKKFRRLRFFKILKALPTSPWLRQIPRVGLGIIREFIARTFRSLGIATKS